MIRQRHRGQHVAGLHPFQAIMQCDPCAGDRSRPGAAICLDHIAIERDLPLSQCLEVNNGA